MKTNLWNARKGECYAIHAPPHRFWTPLLASALPPAGQTVTGCSGGVLRMKHVLVVEQPIWGSVGGEQGLMSDAWHKNFLQDFADAGVQVRMGWALQPHDVQEAWLREATTLVLQSHIHVDAEFLDGAPNLVLLSTPSVGYDNIDAQECARRDIW